jgi:hypothetical protein
MRPLSYEFPNDPKAFGHNDEYMFGDRLLVAPVTLQNATSRSVSVCSWCSLELRVSASVGRMCMLVLYVCVWGGGGMLTLSELARLSSHTRGLPTSSCFRVSSCLIRLTRTCLITYEYCVSSGPYTSQRVRRGGLSGTTRRWLKEGNRKWCKRRLTPSPCTGGSEKAVIVRWSETRSDKGCVACASTLHTVPFLNMLIVLLRKYHLQLFAYDMRVDTLSCHVRVWESKC